MSTVQVWVFKCDRCGHVWSPRKMQESKVELLKLEPKVCPKCKSPYWNVPKKNAKI